MRAHKCRIHSAYRRSIRSTKDADKLDKKIARDAKRKETNVRSV
jgi:hypothetical protein